MGRMDGKSVEPHYRRKRIVVQDYPMLLKNPIIRLGWSMHVMSKKMVILGGGESGVGAAILAAQRGYDVFVSDGGPLKETYREDLKKFSIPLEEKGKSADRILTAHE